MSFKEIPGFSSSNSFFVASTTLISSGLPQKRRDNSIPSCLPPQLRSRIKTRKGRNFFVCPPKKSRF